MVDEADAYAVKINGHTFISMDAVKKLVDEARLDGWTMALEEAAKVADKCDDGSSSEGPLTAYHIAAAIRAMAPKEPR